MPTPLLAQHINEFHENPIYLSGIKLGDNVTACSDLVEAVGGLYVLWRWLLAAQCARSRS